MSIPASNLIDLSERLKIRAVEPRQLSPTEEILRLTMPAAIPDYEIREPQIEMATLIESALTNHEHVMAEAGTGTGKSCAYLIPLHLHLKKTGGRAVVSTGTIALQEQLISKDIPLLESVLHEDFKARLAKGKSNYLCRVRLENEVGQLSGMFLDDEAKSLLQIEDWAHQSHTGDRAELPTEQTELWGKLCADDNCPGKKCPEYDTCFLTRAKLRLDGASIIVTNHSLLMIDMAIKDKTDGHAMILPDYQIVVVDEGHKLTDVAQAALSTQCSNYRLPTLLKQASKVPGIDWNLIEDAKLQNDHFFNLAAAMGQSDKFRLHPTNALVEQGNRVLELVERIADGPDKDVISDHDGMVLTNLLKFFSDLGCILSRDYQNSNVYWVEKSKTSRGGQKTTLHGTPIDVSPMLHDMLFGTMDSVILTSATLSAGGKFSYLEEQVGCPVARELVVESPFDYAQQCLLYLPEKLPDPGSNTFHKELTPVILDILTATRGRALVLFTSYRGMNEVYSLLADRQAAGELPWRVLKQGDIPKRQLLDAFRQDVHSVLLATSSFWEGVDVQGESLSAVIIDRLPFAPPDDPIAQAKADLLRKQGYNDFRIFNHLSMPEAILKLKQGFGRLIRTRTDRGVVAILDSRIVGKRYGATFLRSLPGARVVRELGDVRAFMGEGKCEQIES